ncbi:MAG: hypothetical protein AB8B87_09420 [Granulosicoccus sp.]
MFVVLRYDQREVAHFNVTQNPTAQWTAQQVVEAFPFDTAPRYLLRDRDSIYGEQFSRRVKILGIAGGTYSPEIALAITVCGTIDCQPRCGSIRRECLNHIIVLNERHLRRQLRSYFTYNTMREHISGWQNNVRTRERLICLRKGALLRVPMSVDSIMSTDTQHNTGQNNSLIGVVVLWDTRIVFLLGTGIHSWRVNATVSACGSVDDTPETFDIEN